MKSIMIALLLLVTAIANAQSPDIENLLEHMDEYDDSSEIMRYLQEKADQPINVNKASAQELQTIPWISPVLAAKIIHYRKQNNGIRNVGELRQLPGMENTFYAVQPFLTVSLQPRLDFALRGRHRLQRRLILPQGYTDSTFSGGPKKVYSRIQGTVSDNMSVGLLAEKDAGEKSYTDHTAANVKVKLSPHIELVGGQYSYECGQGLVFWGAYKMFKGSNPIAPGKQRARGLEPFLSTNENAALNGIGLKTRFASCQLDLFYSNKNRDARIENDLITSMPNTGYHRTELEESKRKALREELIGGHLDVPVRHFARIGLSYQQLRFSNAFEQSDEYWQLHSYDAQQNVVLGLNFDATIDPFNFFGEVAQSRSTGKAFFAGLWFDKEHIETILSWRYYEPNFNNIYSNAFGEYSRNQNEKGIYFGWRYHLFAGTRLSFFLDKYAELWPKKSTAMPDEGTELLAQIEHQVNKNLNLTVRLKHKLSDTDVDATDRFGNSVKNKAETGRNNGRIQIDFSPRSAIRIRSRFELTWNKWRHITKSAYAQADSFGTFLYHDIRLKPSSKITLYTRWTSFDAPLYPLRFYQFENEHPGTMRIKMLYGRGQRWYMLVRYVFSFLRLSAKFERTFFDNRTEIGSGPMTIRGQNDTAFSVQLDYKF